MDLQLPPLSIRNLTKNPLELKLLQRFKTNGNGIGLANVTRAFTGLMCNDTSPNPSSSVLSAEVESISSQEVSIPIGPFETKTTDIPVTSDEILRLTIEADGQQRYQVDTPTKPRRSTVLAALSLDPSYEFTAVYLRKSSHLSLYSSAKLESWMSKLMNEVPLSSISIPGTHNSPACYNALPSVRCQAVGVKDQLDHGVRFLDIRVQPAYPDDPSKDNLILVHSAFPISLTGNKYFGTLVDTVYAFLDTNPSETVIMSLKREGVGKSTDQQLSKVLHDHHAQDANRWFTDNRIPTLGEVRNKIVLIRRFALDDSLKGENNGKGWGIDAECWPDNCADGMCASGEIRLQDFYEIAESKDIEKKIGYSIDQLARAAQCVRVPPRDLNTAASGAVSQPLFMNFLSASNFWSAYCWPKRVAAKINPQVVDYLCRSHNEPTTIGPGSDRKETGDGGTGIVVCDWVGKNGDWDLVKCIIGMNAKLELR